MSLLDQKVQGEPTPAPVTEKPVTPAGEGVAATPATTPTQTPQSDALAQEKQRFEKDLNQLKSTLQRREAQLTKEAKEREAALLKQLEETKLQGMDDEARKAYEATRFSRENETLKQQLEEERRRYQEYQVFQNSVLQFRSAGVPEANLVLDGSLDDLVQSGWDYLTSRVRELESKLTAPVTPAPKELPAAPEVDTGKSQSVNTKPTWPELIAKYGSRERVYELVEQRQLNPEIIP